MRHVDLFSGIGGFAIAAQRCGFQTIAFAEIDRFASSILKRHWPDVQNYGDVRRFDGLPCELLTGGFPCQPFSLAGKRQGKADDRYLWPEMLRIIKRSRPRWVIGENVAGIVSMELDQVLFDLEAIHYTARAVVIPACAVDAHHRRDRVWILANSIGWGEDRNGSWTGHRAMAGSDGYEDVSDSEIHGWHQKRQEPEWNEEGEGKEKFEQPSGFHQWPAEPGVCRVAHGIPGWSHRIRSLGNAIVPQVAEHLIRSILSVDRTLKKSHNL